MLPDDGSYASEWGAAKRALFMARPGGPNDPEVLLKGGIDVDPILLAAAAGPAAGTTGGPIPIGLGSSPGETTLGASKPATGDTLRPVEPATVATAAATVKGNPFPWWLWPLAGVALWMAVELVRGVKGGSKWA